MKSKRMFFYFVLGLSPLFLLGCSGDIESSLSEEAASSSTSAGVSSTPFTGEEALYWTSHDAYGRYCLDGYLGDSENIIIPSSVGGLPISVLNNFLFADRSNLKSVTIPSSIVAINEGVFRGCHSLTKVVFQGSVSYIGGSAFKDCSSLSSISLPDSVTTIGAGAFQDCVALKSIVLPSNLTYFDNYVFEGCTLLSSISISSENGSFSSSDGVLFDKNKDALIAFPGGIKGAYEIPATVTRIQDGALFECSLSSLTLPAALSFIQDGAFQGSDSLSTLTLSSENQYYSVEGNVLFSKDKTVIVSYLGGLVGAYVVPSSVTAIGNAFYDCAGLSSINISSQLIDFSPSSFFGNSNLESIAVDTANPSWMSDSGALYSKDGSSLKFVPNALSGSISVLDGTVSIGNGAFHGCSKITSITLPNSLKNIGVGAFYGCSSLISFTCPASYGYIEAYTFYGCSALQMVSFLGKIIGVRDYAFYGCISLASIDFANGLTAIGKACFMNCSSLVSIRLPASAHGIGNYAFFNCSKLATITIESYITSFGKYCFGNCTSLASLNVPETTIESGFTTQPSVTLYEGAFAFCNQLSSIVLPTTTIFVGARCFAKDSLLSIYFSATSLDTVTLIADWNILSGNGYTYSAAQPASAGHYWHYVNSIPTAW